MFAAKLLVFQTCGAHLVKTTGGEGGDKGSDVIKLWMDGRWRFLDVETSVFHLVQTVTEAKFNVSDVAINVLRF